MKKILLALFCVMCSCNAVFAATRYYVEKSIDDEVFIINGEVFKAQTYCFGILEGDVVVFTEGSPFGACAFAEFINLRTKDICRVWCE